MRREEASDFEYAEGTMHLVVTEAARRARQLVPPPQEIAHPFRHMNVYQAKGCVR